MSPKIFRITLLLLLPIFASCNLFSPLSSSADDPESLVDQGVSYLQNGENEKALDNFQKALDKDPDNYDALYYHSVATVRVNGLDFNTFIETFQDEGDAGFNKSQRMLHQTFSVQNDTLFDIAVEELTNIVQTFLTVHNNLKIIVNAIIAQELSADEFPFIEDVMLSYGMSSMVANMILMLDTDGEGPDFQLDTNFLLQRVDDAFQIVYVGDPNAVQNIQAAIAERINRNWPGIEAGVTSLYVYYTWSQCGSWPAEGQIPEISNLLNSDQLLAGYLLCGADSEDAASYQLFEIAYLGTSAFYEILVQAGLVN